MSQYSTVYYHCPKCRGVRFKKRGRPKDKIYQCLRCGTLRNRGKKVDIKGRPLK